jgi:hypothetical protein
VICHSNCFACTPIGYAPGGTLSRPLIFVHRPLLMMPRITTVTAGTADHTTSAFALPCV